MRTATALTVLAALLALAGFADTASAATVAWADPNGSGDGFTFTDGGSDHGLFGTPVVSGNRFFFHPVAFKAHDHDGTDGVSADASDRLFVTIEAAPGDMITGIGIEEWGDYHIVVGGEVNVFGTLFLTKIEGPADVKDSQLVPDPAVPITTVGNGTWTAETFIDLSGGPGPWTKLILSLDNDLVANATGAGANAKIQKKVITSGVIITVIPEPATLAMLGLGALALLRRGRR